MSISENIDQSNNNKIEQNKAQYDLDRKTAKISALSSRNVSKYEFLISKDVLPEKYFLEKVAAIKKSERTEKENWIFNSNISIFLCNIIVDYMFLSCHIRVPIMNPHSIVD